MAPFGFTCPRCGYSCERVDTGTTALACSGWGGLMNTAAYGSWFRYAIDEIENAAEQGAMEWRERVRRFRIRRPVPVLPKPQMPWGFNELAPLARSNC